MTILKKINKLLTLFAILLFLLALSSSLFSSKSEQIELPALAQTNTTSLDDHSHSYSSIGESILQLKKVAPSIQIPDLRNTLVFYGFNSRPDTNLQKIEFHFGIRGEIEATTVYEKEPLYLLFNKEHAKGKYTFSPNNKPTSLWLEPLSKGEKAFVTIHLLSPDGQTITPPKELAYFEVAIAEFNRTTGKQWKIDNNRVDGGLLARQKARWYGKDLFLEHHGGKEYQWALGKQRIDFGEEEEHYSVYVDNGETLIWKDRRWQVAKPTQETQQYPLLQVKNIDNKLMRLELWDSEGRGKILLHLAKSLEMWSPKIIEEEFKFVGTRTKKQSLIEINNERVCLDPYDWLLHRDNQWYKLSSEVEVDEYVDGKRRGELFIFDHIIKKEGQYLLIGQLYNTTRSDLEMLELPLQKGNGIIAKNNKKPIRDKRKKAIVSSPLNFEMNDDEEFHSIPHPFHDSEGFHHLLMTTPHHTPATMPQG